MEEELAALESQGYTLERLSDTYLLVLIPSSVEKVRVYIEVPDDYPNSALLVQVSSQFLPEQLLTRLEKTVAHHLSTSASQTPIGAAVAFLNTTLSQNKLLYCWQEIMQSKELLGPEDTLKTLEKRGVLVFSVSLKQLKEGPHKLVVRVTVPAGYPHSAVTFDVQESSFPSKVFEIVVNRGQHLLANSLVTNTLGRQEEALPLSREEMKHDLDFIKIKQDLEAQSDLKAARRLRTRLIKREVEMEKAAIVARQGQQVSHLNRTLFALAQFFVQQVMRDLPHQPCLACKQPVLASGEPEMVVCGHWFHWQCLRETMRTPPFEKFCDLCGSRIHHPKYPTDPKALERMAKAWSMEQARTREIEDVKDFLDL